MAVSTKFKIIPTVGDGHCLLHAIVNSWKLQITSSKAPTVHDLLCSIFSEAISNSDKYRLFLPNTTQFDYIKSIQRYLILKHYNSNFGDIVPNIISNTLSINLNINDTVNGSSQTTVITPDNVTTNYTIYIHRVDEHYSTLQPVLTTGDPTNHHSNTSQNGYSRPISYSRSTLLALRQHTPQINRTVRKKLFKFNLWKPSITDTPPSHRQQPWPMEREGKPATPSIHRQQPWPMDRAYHSVTTSKSTTNEISTIITTDRPKHRHKKRSCSYRCYPPYDNKLSDITQKLKLSVINIRSVKNKTAALLHHITTSNIDICSITESWINLDDLITINQLRTDLFDFHVIPRPNRTGGGTAILFRKSLDIVLHSSGCLKSFEFSIWKINNKHLPCFLVIIYRPPYSPNHPITASAFIEEFSNFIADDLPNQHQDIIITGDFNIHFDDKFNTTTKAFNDLLQSFGLIQHVTSPTHVNGHTLDYIITHDNSDITVTTPSTDYFISDHCFVTTYININKPKVANQSISFRKIKEIDAPAFSSDLTSAINNLQNLPTDDVNILVAAYNTNIASVLNKHAPIKTKSISARKKVPWFDEEALKLKRVKRKLERKWRISKTPEDKLSYLNACSNYKDHLNKSKDLHLNNLISNCGNDSRKLFNVVKQLTGKSKQIILPTGSSDNTLAHNFCNFFLNKITKIRNDLDQFDSFIPPKISTSNFATFSPISQDSVAKLITSSKAATCDSDPIPTSMVKTHSQIFAPILTRIINLSLSSSKFASCWKNAIITPLIKKQNLDKNVFSNYRPISNLSFLSKLTEKAALSQLCPYIESNNLLPPYQSAYRKYYSTETATIKVVNDILWNMERQNITSLVAMDLSAAFDTVDHSILLEVLESCFGIQNNALNWLNSYLQPRYMHVKINNTNSEPQHLPFSVPQGSAAGPILYTAYASTMQHAINKFNTKISGYADDHIIYNGFPPSSATTVLNSQESCIEAIRLWMNRNRLKMNDDKTEFILCGHRSQLKKCQNNELSVGNAKIKSADCIKYLGIYLDAELDFKHHIQQKCKIASLNLRNIKSIRNHLSDDSCKTLVQALVISHLDYGNTIFADLPDSTLKPAQLIQNHAAKVILKRKKFDSATAALKDLHWLPIRQRCKFKLLLMIHKCLNNQAPSYLQDLLTPMSTPIRTTRSSADITNKLLVPRTKRITFASRSFSVAGPQHWNTLPNHIRNCKNTDTFRRLLKTHLFQDYYKSSN